MASFEAQLETRIADDDASGVRSLFFGAEVPESEREAHWSRCADILARIADRGRSTDARVEAMAHLVSVGQIELGDDDAGGRVAERIEAFVPHVARLSWLINRHNTQTYLARGQHRKAVDESRSWVATSGTRAELAEAYSGTAGVFEAWDKPNEGQVVLSLAALLGDASNAARRALRKLSDTERVAMVGEIMRQIGWANLQPEVAAIRDHCRLCESVGEALMPEDGWFERQFGAGAAFVKFLCRYHPSNSPGGMVDEVSKLISRRRAMPPLEVERVVPGDLHAANGQQSALWRVMAEPQEVFNLRLDDGRVYWSWIIEDERPRWLGKLKLSPTGIETLILYTLASAGFAQGFTPDPKDPEGSLTNWYRHIFETWGGKQAVETRDGPGKSATRDELIAWARRTAAS